MYKLLTLKLTVIRLALAALHYNENAGGKQAVTRQGEERYDTSTKKEDT